MKIKKYLFGLLLMFFAMALTGCSIDDINTDDIDIDEVAARALLADIAISYAEGDSASSVTEDITLATIDIDVATLTWTSSNTDVIDDTGKIVARGESDTEVTLRATINYDDVSVWEDFQITVKAEIEEATPLTIGEAIDETPGVIAEVQGFVSGISDSGFMITDGENSIYTYRGDMSCDCEIGDFVTISGAITNYQVNQFDQTAQITVTETTEVAPVLENTTLDETSFDEYIEEGVVTGQLITINAKVDGGTAYVNLIVDGSKYNLTAVNPSSEIELNGLSTYEISGLVLYAKEYNDVNGVYLLVTSATLVDTGVTPEDLPGELSTTIGFENSEGFEGSTSYNNTKAKEQGAEGAMWSIIEGTVSTTNPIADSQSLQFRDYQSNEVVGSAIMEYTIDGVSYIRFQARNTEGYNIKISYSTDEGTTWLEEETFVLSTNTELFVYNIAENVGVDNVQIKFDVVQPETLVDKARVYIDNVEFYTITPTE